MARRMPQALLPRGQAASCAGLPVPWGPLLSRRLGALPVCLALCREETGSEGGVGGGLGPKPTPILRTRQSWGMKSLQAESPQYLHRWPCITKWGDGRILV